MNNTSADIVIATHNSHKVRELEPFFTGLTLCDARALNEPPKEDGLSFIENACIKARAACRASQCSALADDSGLMVHALSGEPGIHSARYAGVEQNDHANVEKLIHRVSDLPDRSATFVCVLVAMLQAHDPCPVIAVGVLHGQVSCTPQGVEGFGYDPCFIPAGQSRSIASLGHAYKAQHSHRSMAVRALLCQLKSEPRWMHIMKKLS